MASSNHDMNLIIKAKDQASGVINKTMADWKTAVLAVGGAYLGFEGIKKTVSWVITSGLEAEKTWNAVAASLRRHNFEVKTNIDSIQKFSSQLQSATAFSDELIGRGIQRLIDSNMDLSTAYRTMEAAADLARAKDIDLMTAVELLSRASMGVTQTLTRYGIVIDENIPKAKKFEAVLAQLNERFGGAARADMDSTARRIELLGERWTDLGEQLSKITNPALYDFVNLATQALNLVNKTPASMNELRTALDAVNMGGFSFIGWMNVFRQSTLIAMDAVEKSLRPQLEKLKADFDSGKLSLVDLNLELIKFYKGLGEKESAELQKSLNRIWRELENDKTKIEETKREIDLVAQGIKLAAAEDAAYIESLADSYIKQAEIYSTAASGRINAVIQMKEEELETYSEFDELISSNAFKELDKRTKVELDKARLAAANKINFANAASRGMMAAFQTASDSIIGRLTFLQKTSGGIFGAMARDFMKYFIESALESLAKVFVVKALKILGGLFDNPINDAMAARQGADFAKYFAKGAIQGLQNIGNIISMNIPITAPALAYAGGGTTYNNITLNFGNAQIDNRFVQDEIIPAIEKAVAYKQSRIITSVDNITGRRDVQLR